jgi:threonine/homoserine/homoserine lactone efflux protein
MLLNIMPGPDTILILSRSAAGGRVAGLSATAGIVSGTFVHIFAAAFGLSAILATSANAFTLVKLIGAAYLCYLGFSMLVKSFGYRRASVATRADVRPAGASLRKCFAQGFLSNVLNPKVALFFLAFVPQFIVPSAQNKPLAFLFLGTLFNFNGMLWAIFLALAAASISERAKAFVILRIWFERTVGALFVGLGVRLALSGQR